MFHISHVTPPCHIMAHAHQHIQGKRHSPVFPQLYHVRRISCLSDVQAMSKRDMAMHASASDILHIWCNINQCKHAMQMQSPYPKFNNACLVQSSQVKTLQNSRQSFPPLFLKIQIQLKLKNLTTVQKVVSKHF